MARKPKPERFPVVGAFLCTECTHELCSAAKELKNAGRDVAAHGRRGITERAAVFICVDCILGVAALSEASRPHFERISADLRKRAAKKRRTK